MDRRQLIASLPLTGLAGSALAQRGAPPSEPVQPSLPMTILAEGLQFPEAPVVMKDGSVLFVEIQRRTVSRLTPAGKVEVVVQFNGPQFGPNGLAVGPDGHVYIANDGARWTYAMRNGVNISSSAPPPWHDGGWIQRLDLKTGHVTTLYDSVAGRKLRAPDDLVFDHHGGMWITDYGDKANDGALVYATPDGKHIKIAREPMAGPNGIGVSPDGKMLYVTSVRSLYGFDIVGPGELATKTFPHDGKVMPLNNNGYADSLKIQADGRICACTLFMPGGIGIMDPKAKATEFMAFGDPMTCNLAFGGADMHDCWVMLSGHGKIAKVRWPYPGQKPAYSA